MKEALQAGRSRRVPGRGPARFVLPALLLVVAFAVFAWGTAYKTSLYKAPEVGRAPAKLCTRASDASRAQLERAVESPVIHPIYTGVLALVYTALHPPLRVRNLLLALEADHTPPYLRSSSSLFHRPPPVSLHLT